MRDRTTWLLLAIALVLAVIAWQQGGPELAWAGIAEGAKTLIGVTPLLAAAFLIAGLIQVLISEEMVNRWLGRAAGWRGIAIACIGGALIPGGPYVYYPIAASLLKSGAGLGVLVAFISAKNLWSVTRLPLEFALLGTHLTLIRIAVTLIIPPLLGFLAELLFGHLVDRIQEGVRA